MSIEKGNLLDALLHSDQQQLLREHYVNRQYDVQSFWKD